MSESSRISPGERPFVTMNVAASIDGKIAPVGGGKVNFGSAEDRALMEELRARADGVVIGGGTLRSEDPPLIIRDPEVRGRRLVTKGKPHPLNITVSTGLPDGLAEMDFFREPETEKLVFTTERASPALRETAGRFARVEVVALDASGRVDLTEVLRGLPRLGVRNLLLEGGGELNFSMLQADLIDEIYLTLCPFAFGGRTAPTPFDGDGLPKERVRKLALRESRVGSKGELFLRYELLREAPTVDASRLFRKGYEIR